jgi:sphingomyelin phosphodiesterase
MDCNTCKVSLLSLQLAKNEFKKQFLKELLKFCVKSHSEQLCQQGIPKYGSIIFDSVFYHYMDPEFACGYVLKACPSTEAPQNMTDYIQNVLANKPNIPLPTPTLKSTFKVLQVSDIHLDPLYLENAIVDCSGSICCRQLPNSTNATNLSGYWGTPASCDLPFRTAEQMAMFISENLEVDMILWTGDNSQHDIEKTSEQNINNTLVLSNLFKQYFPNIPVYPALGNSETYPIETWNFNYDPKIYSDSEEKIYEKAQEQFESTFTAEWKQWLGSDAVAEFSKHGFYSSYNEQLQLRVISINTEACHEENFYLLLDPTDPGGMLVWLQNTLTQSEQNSENVYIIGHIPPSCLDCYPQWSNRFGALVERYSHIIRGQFFGHLHSDTFFIYKSFLNQSETVQMGFLAPSLTPNYKRNPSFRVYEIDMDTKIPVNYQNYVLDIVKANQDPSQPLKWEVAYDFLSTYNFKDLSLDTYDTLREELVDNDAVYNNFKQHYAAGNPGLCPSKMSLYCSVLGTYDQVVDCFKEYNVTHSESMEHAGLEMLSGVWMNKTIGI